MTTQIKTAVALTDQWMGTVWNPQTETQEPHWVYRAVIPMKRKGPTMKLVMCDADSNVSATDDVDIEWHVGMRCYVHRQFHTTTEDNSHGGFTEVPIM